MSQSERPADASSTADGPELRVIIAQAMPACRPETVQWLSESSRLRSAQRGDVIYREGDPVPLTVVLQGYGAFRRTTMDGQPLMIGVAAAGNLFGFSGMASVPSSVEFVALSDCQVAQWPGDEVRAIAETDIGLAFEAVQSIATSLHAMMERVEGFLHQDARRRVVRILSRHRDLFFREPPILTRADLPSLVGTSREMTGRVLRQLELEGTVERVGRSGLRLLRPDRFDSGAA